MDLLSIKVDDIPEGGMSVDIPGRRKSGKDADGGFTWKKELVPLEVHTVIDGRSWQDELLGFISDSYLKFPGGFSGRINLFRSGQSVIVKGQIVTLAEMTCSRCAETRAAADSLVGWNRDLRRFDRRPHRFLRR